LDAVYLRVKKNGLKEEIALSAFVILFCQQVCIVLSDFYAETALQYQFIPCTLERSNRSLKLSTQYTY